MEPVESRPEGGDDPELSGSEMTASGSGAAAAQVSSSVPQYSTWESPQIDPSASAPLSPPSITADADPVAAPVPPSTAPDDADGSQAARAGGVLVLGDRPMFEPVHDPSAPGHRQGKRVDPVRLPMLPLRIVAIAGVAMGLALFGWQVSRVIDEQPRLASLAWGSILAGLVGAIGLVLWTFVVAENARRVMDPATTQQLPLPGRVASTWVVPLAFVTISTASVSYLSRRLNTPIEGTESSVPLILAVLTLLVSFALMYTPANALTGVVRKIGGHGVKLAEWLLVPIALGAVGAAMIYGLHAGGAYDGTDHGFVPTWVVAVAGIVPATVLVFLGWRAAAAVESDVLRAFERRLGRARPLGRRRRLFAQFSDDGPNHAVLRERGQIRQLPGVNVVSSVITAAMAGLALLSVIGAVVMYLFWQEGRDGVLLPTQRERAWDLLSTFQAAERTVAFAAMVMATLWAAMVVTNVRMASARRRNPLIAGLSWPMAAAGIWIVGDRVVADASASGVVLGFAAQAALLYVPFAVLERSADAVSSRRSPIRFSYALGVVLLVYIQGLGGLSTLTESTENGEIGRLAGYLAVGALVQLLAMFAVTEATRSLSDATRHLADHHNDLVDRSAEMASRRSGPQAVGWSGN